MSWPVYLSAGPFFRLAAWELIVGFIHEIISG